jgi:hypothetical protein
MKGEEGRKEGRKKEITIIIYKLLEVLFLDCI